MPKKRIQRERDGTWGCNVWFGSYTPTNLRRNYYATRAQARNADISHVPGKFGCVKIGGSYKD